MKNYNQLLIQLQGMALCPTVRVNLAIMAVGHKTLPCKLVAWFCVLILIMLTGCGKHTFKLQDSHPPVFSASPVSDAVHAMELDAHGYLWIGSERGINIFDGSNYLVITHENADTSSLRSDNIVNIYKDRQGMMWVMTDDGIDCYQGNGIFQHFYSDAAVQASSSMIQTKNGNILALYGGELCILKGQRFQPIMRLFTSFGDIYGTKLIEVGDGRLIVNTGNGVFEVSNNYKHFKRLPFRGRMIVCADANNICFLSFEEGIKVMNHKDLSLVYSSNSSMPTVAEDATLWKGKLIFSGYEGIFEMDMRAHKISTLPQNIQNEYKPKYIQRLYTDPNGVLWFGYTTYGIRKIEDIAKTEQTLVNDSIYKIFRQSGVRGVTEDTSGNIFGALHNDSVFYISKDGNSVSAAALSSLISIHSRQHVQSVAYSAGLFWVVTTSNVLALHYDNGFHVDEFFDVGLATNSSSGTSATVSQGLAMITGNNSLLVFDALHKTTNVDDIRLAFNNKPVTWRQGSMNIRNIPLRGGVIPMSAHLTPVSGNRLLATFQDNLAWLVDENSGKVEKINLDLGTSIISSASVGSHSFLGTADGLYVYDGTSRNLTKVKEIGDKPVNNIIAADNGLTLTCEGNILLFDPTTHSVRTLWQGSPQSDFQPLTLVKQGSNILFAATRQGFKQFDIAQQGLDVKAPKLYIEGIDAYMDNNLRRSCALFTADSASKVVLTHNENTLDIRYAAITPTLSGNYTYRYRLNGYDEDWHESDGSGVAHYTKIEPGKYRFEIQCTDRQHPWITVHKSLTIRVEPHPLLSTTAYIIYIMLLIAGLYFANRLYIRMRMVRINADTAAREKDRERQINKMNMNFFANISHEFRNPITMIAGPVSTLRKAPELSRQSRNMVKLISQSSRTLMRLVDQMLDFNLLEGDAMRLSVSRTDVAAIISEYAHRYEVSAAEKGINIICVGTDKPLVMLADEDKVVKVLDNLMSIAIKHTPQNGTITVSLSVNGNEQTLMVENTGAHIPEQVLPDIFKRYYQGASGTGDWGVGIGLHYVRSLVRLHHGTIKADNTPSGICFTVVIPTNDDAYSADERKPRNRKIDEYQPLAEDDIVRPLRNEVPVVGEEKKPCMLIVEKDVNTAYFLRKYFEGDYTVVNRYDADTALDEVAEIRPDIIISCIMLDGKSGLDFCRELRSIEQFAATPFIFLTTCNSDDQQAEGMRAGADAYITKPFAPEYVREVVGRLLAHADAYKKLEERLPQQPEQKDATDLSAKDKEMLRVIKKFMKENIDDGELDVAKLSRRLLLSRTKLYEKIKALTGKTPNELFRTYKLSYAAELLKEGKLNVSEISQKAGFSSVAFFSRTFKKYYGVSPKNYD